VSAAKWRRVFASKRNWRRAVGSATSRSKKWLKSLALRRRHNAHQHQRRGVTIMKIIICRKYQALEGIFGINAGVMWRK